MKLGAVLMFLAIVIVVVGGVKALTGIWLWDMIDPTAVTQILPH